MRHLIRSGVICSKVSLCTVVEVALVKEALALDQVGKTSEALDIYDQMIQSILLRIDRSGIEPWLAVVLLNRSRSCLCETGPRSANLLTGLPLIL